MLREEGGRGSIHLDVVSPIARPYTADIQEIDGWERWIKKVCVCVCIRTD